MWNDNTDRGGNKNPFFGKHHTEENKLKISEKMSNGNHHQAKKIGSADGRIWNTVKECAEELDVNKNHLSSMLLGKEKFPKKLTELKLIYLQ